MSAPEQDYQAKMGEDTRQIDQMGNDAAEEKTVKNFAAGKEWVSSSDGRGHTYKTMDTVFGMLPDISMPLDATLDREQAFSKIALAHKDNGWGDAPSGTSLAQMEANYIDDRLKLPSAAGQYNLMTPLANMAARAYAKADTVGAISDKEWNLDNSMSDHLDKKEQKAIGEATATVEPSKVTSLTHASTALAGARLALDSASHTFAAVTNEEAMAGLQAAMKVHEDKKAEIEASKAKILQVVGFVETAGSLVAGGAGAVAGAPTAVMTDDMRSDVYGTAESVGGAVGGGMISSAVSFGIDLINHKALAHLDNQIAIIKNELAAYGQVNHWHKIEAARTGFDAAVTTYGNAVSVYNDTIEERRSTMAKIGKAADLKVDKKEKNHDSSQAMLWMEVVMELQVHLQTALLAGKTTLKTLNDVETTVTQHRNYHYGVADEHWTANNKPHTEVEIQGGRGGADADALHNMVELTSDWVSAGSRVAALVDTTVNDKMAPFMKDSGYSGKF